ncbi:MarR family winged helix-turn-helix transcriptional regulator [Paralimibaculum aggregatum]
MIEAIGRLGAVSQAVLVPEFGVTSASMSTMTDRLLAAGYVTRTVDPASRRKNRLGPAGKGRALPAGITAAWDATDETIRAVPGADAAAFSGLARRLRDGLGGRPPGGRIAERAGSSADRRQRLARRPRAPAPAGASPSVPPAGSPASAAPARSRARAPPPPNAAGPSGSPR